MILPGIEESFGFYFSEFLVHLNVFVDLYLVVLITVIQKLLNRNRKLLIQKLAFITFPFLILSYILAVFLGFKMLALYVLNNFLPIFVVCLNLALPIPTDIILDTLS